jgi:hypothetical protein
MLAQTGVIILELNHPDEAVVSAYAVAFQTGTFVVILATATNRLYAPRISALLDRGDLQALRSMARYRLLVIGPLTLLLSFRHSCFRPVHPVAVRPAIRDGISCALPDRAWRLDQHDLFVGANLYALHQPGSHRARGARGRRRAEPRAVHSAQRPLRGAARLSPTPCRSRFFMSACGSSSFTIWCATSSPPGTPDRRRPATWRGLVLDCDPSFSQGGEPC